jgi:hypothetical protein
MRLGTLVLIAALLFLLGGAIVFTHLGLTGPDGPIPTRDYVVMGVGAIAALAVWIVLVALLFYGTREPSVTSK